MEIDNVEDLTEYKIAKKVWEDIFNNDTLIYENFDQYFIDNFYTKSLIVFHCEICNRKYSPKQEHNICFICSSDDEKK